MTTSNVLHFPDRSLLKLIDAVNGVLSGDTEPAKALTLAETVLRDMGAVQDAKGKWSLPNQPGKRETTSFGQGMLDDVMAEPPDQPT